MPRKGTAKVPQGLSRLLTNDPAQFLLFAVERVQQQGSYHRLGRVLRRLQRRKYEPGWVHATTSENPCDRIIAAQLLGYNFREDISDRRVERVLENGQYVHLRWYNYFLSLPPIFEVRVAQQLRMWPIVGEADVMVSHPDIGVWVVELKSMNTDEWKSLQQPRADHFAQVNNYLGIASVQASGQIWCENKNNQDVKTFCFQHDAERFEATYQRVRHIADLVCEGRLPAGCQRCPFDKAIGDLHVGEERWTALREQRHQWLDKHYRPAGHNGQSQPNQPQPPQQPSKPRRRKSRPAN